MDKLLGNKQLLEQMGQGSEVLIPFLSDMADAIGELAETMQKMIPEGRIRSTTITVTDTPQLLGETEWVSAVFYNDGPDNVYLFDEYQVPRVGFDAPIKPGEGLPIDFRAKIGQPKYVVCAAGESASGRVFRMW